MQIHNTILKPFCPTSTLSIAARVELMPASGLLPAACLDPLRAPRDCQPVTLDVLPVCLRTPSSLEVLNRGVIDLRAGLHDPSNDLMTIVIEHDELARPEHEVILRYRYQELEPVLLRVGGRAWQHAITRVRTDPHLARTLAAVVFSRNGNRLSHAEEHALLGGVVTMSSIEKFKAVGQPGSDTSAPESSPAARAPASQAPSRGGEVKEHENGFEPPTAQQRADVTRTWDSSEARSRKGLPCLNVLEQELREVRDQEGRPVVDVMVIYLARHAHKPEREREHAYEKAAERLAHKYLNSSAVGDASDA